MIIEKIVEMWGGGRGGGTRLERKEKEREKKKGEGLNFEEGGGELDKKYCSGGQECIMSKYDQKMHWENNGLNRSARSLNHDLYQAHTELLYDTTF